MRTFFHSYWHNSDGGAVWRCRYKKDHPDKRTEYYEDDDKLVCCRVKCFFDKLF